MSIQNLIDTKLQNPVLQDIINFTANTNYNAFLIGGFVRDIFLYRNSKDIDIVVEKDGLQFAKELADFLKVKKVSIFKTYGTAQIIYKGVEIEIVNARKESYTLESRNPQVQQGTLLDDQNRRDFTINALAIDLKKPFALIDPFDGLADLDNLCIKTPLDPNITFSDDPLRMLRAIRFASQLGFKINDETFDAIIANKDRVKILSKERITEELNKIMASPVPSIGFYLMDDAGILEIIFPEFCELKGTEKINGLSHKDNFIHTLEVLDNMAKISNNIWLRYAALLHDIAKPMTKRFEPGIGFTFHGHEFKGVKMVKDIFTNLKLPLNDKLKYVQKLVLLHLRPIALTKEIVTDSAIRRLIVDAEEDIEDLLMLCQCDITSKDEAKKEKYLKNLKQVKKKIEEVTERDKLRNWQPCVSGDDIIKLIQIAHPKEIGLLKNSIRDAILDGDIKDIREEALEYLFAKAKEMGLTLKNN